MPLLLKSNEQHAVRSHAIYNDMNEVIAVCFQRYATFLSDVIDQLKHYFDWSECKWLSISENIFLFTGPNENESLLSRVHFRQNELEELFSLPHSPQPLTEPDKILLKSQYKTLYLKACDILKRLKTSQNYQHMAVKHINNLIWYEICTDAAKFQNIKQIIDYALRFFIRDGNKCPVESLIGDVDFVKGTRRTKLEYENMHKQMFIRKNGPHPLLSENVRKCILNKMFQKGWHFIKGANLTLPSTVYQTKMKKIKYQEDYCF